MPNLGEILEKKELARGIKLIKVSATPIATRAKAGQFIILRIDEQGERIPLTIADSDASLGTLTLIFQEVGKTTMQLGALSKGDRLTDIIGPLGHPTHVENFGTVVTIGGGVGTAVIYPVAKALKEARNKIISIVGARSKEMLILEKEMRETSDNLYITTDDGSYGRYGFVTDELKGLIDEGRKIDLVFAIGPCVMMKAVSNLTKEHNLKTMVSLNSIMVDGTGMCGSCRVTVGNETKFVCVDGPDFEADKVNFGELMDRQRIYLDEERLSMERYINRR